MAEIQHEDKCRWWDDGEFCDCGAIETDRLEKELAEARDALEKIAAESPYEHDHGGEDYGHYEECKTCQKLIKIATDAIKAK